MSESASEQTAQKDLEDQFDQLQGSIAFIKKAEKDSGEIISVLKKVESEAGQSTSAINDNLKTSSDASAAIKNFLSQSEDKFEEIKTSFDSQKKKFEALAARSESKASELAEIQEKLSKDLSSVEEDRETINNAASEIEEIKEQSVKVRLKITESVEKIDTAQTRVAEILEQAEEDCEKITSGQKTSEANVEKISLGFEKVKQLIADLFDDVIGDGKTAAKLSLKSRLVELKNEVEKSINTNQQFIEETSERNIEFQTKTDKDFQDLKIRLENEIRELLPSAAAAGLAKTYFNAKERYANFYSGAFLYAVFLGPLIWGAYALYAHPVQEVGWGDFFHIL